MCVECGATFPDNGTLSVEALSLKRCLVRLRLVRKKKKCQPTAESMDTPQASCSRRRTSARKDSCHQIVVSLVWVGVENKKAYQITSESRDTGLRGVSSCRMSLVANHP